MTINRRAALVQLAVIGVTGAALTREAAAQTTYKYDALGRLRRVTYADGSTVDYVYDEAGNRSQVVRTGPGNFSATIAITGTSPVNLRTLANAAGYNGFRDATITYTLANTVTITGAAGASDGGIAIDSGVWPTDEFTMALTLQISGKVYGGGGKGGRGSGGGASQAGGKGGDAIYCQTPMSITVNSGGEVKAGGGGGGGGGGWFNNISEHDLAGGGAGGGFPNGTGGVAGTSDYGTGAANGAAGTTSGGGAGGAGDSLADSHTGGAGGAGGGAGAAGGDGNNGGGSTGSGWVIRQRSTGSVAGYAIRKNGNTVTVTNNGTITGTQG